MKLVQNVVLPLAALLLSASSFVPVAGASLKCGKLLQVPGLEPGEPLVLVDGKIRESGSHSHRGPRRRFDRNPLLESGDQNVQ